MSDREFESSDHEDLDDSNPPNEDDSEDFKDSNASGDSDDDGNEVSNASGDGDDDSDDFTPPKKKFKPDVLTENVSIKVDEKIYPLNRVQLALKSNYFEKLFVEDFAEKNSDVVEIKALNSDMFSAIVDLMNGNDLESVMNVDNFVSLLMGMDYLQMEIDLKLVKSFLFKTNSVVNVIQLYNFVTANQNFRYLERKVLRRISAHLVKITKHAEKFILCLPFEQFVRIIRHTDAMWCEFYGKQTVQAKETLSQICSNWICHDVENRIQHFTAIVNAANYGFYKESFLISSEKVEPLLDEIKKDTNRERIQKCIQKLLSYSGEIIPDVGQFDDEKKPSDKIHIVNGINEGEKLSRFLKEGILSDVTVKVGAKTYKLHRSILTAATSYFSGPNSTSDKYPEFVLDIDEKTFDSIVNFIYFDKIPKFDSHPKRKIMQMLKAAATLNSKLIIVKCCIPFMKKIKDDLNCKDITELLNLARKNNWQSESWMKQILEDFIYREDGVSNDIFRIRQISEAAGLKDISLNFDQSITSKIYKMDYTDLLKTFDVLCEVNDAGNYCLYIDCLCKLIIAPESDPSVESHLVSISCDVLEDLLGSTFFIISDPQKIVDICSKWIVHDVKNRYRLIPRIVFAINRNNSMNFDGFESNSTDLSNCSQKDINDELWKLLNSNCLLSRDLGSEPTNWNVKSMPMFILPKDVDENTRRPKEVCVVDSELNEIASLNFLLSHYVVSEKYDRLDEPKLSATLIGDTLFVLCEIRDKFKVYAYNFSSKKLNVLAAPFRRMYYPMDFLLNCNNQLIWCFDDGRVMKYSIELNRWLQIYSSSESKNHGPYGSDGSKLFRWNCQTIEVFDFGESSWTHYSNLPWFSSVSKMRPIRLTWYRNGFAVIFTPMMFSTMLVFDSGTKKWKEITTPGSSYRPVMEFNAHAVPYEESFLYAGKRGIHYLPRPYSRWEVKKSASSESSFLGIVAIQILPEY